MDEPSHGAEPQPPEPALPPDFVPLRLALQPGGMLVEVLQADALVGRHSAADVRLPLPDVSRRHCRLLWNAGRWQVIDLSSLNGIFVNDVPVTQADLKAGDELRIGGFTFVVQPALPAPQGTEPLVQTLFGDRKPVPFLPPRRRAS
jgi:pSer/pThr/pTyr-binding forkhead associated (FHA) protein